MNPHTLNAQAQLITEIHAILRRAEATLSQRNLSAIIHEANDLIDSDEFLALPEQAQEDILERYGMQTYRLMPAGV